MDDTGNSPLADDSVTDDEKARAQRETANLRTRFMELIPEIRNQIYHHVIEDDLVVQVNGYYRKDGEGSNFVRTPKLLDKRHLNLLHICRSIREVTLPVYFGKTTFRFALNTVRDCTVARDFLYVLLPEGAVTSLRKVYFHSVDYVTCNCASPSTFSRNDHYIIRKAYIDLDNRDQPYDAKVTCRGRCRTCNQTYSNNEQKSMSALIAIAGARAVKGALNRGVLMLQSLTHAGGHLFWQDDPMKGVKDV